MKREAIVSFVLVMVFSVAVFPMSISGGAISSNRGSEVLGAQSTVDPVDWWTMFHHDLAHTGYSTSKAPETNQLLWNTTINGYVTYGSPAVADGKVYVNTGGLGLTYNYVYGLNASTGANIWTFNQTPGDGGAASTPAVAYGKVYVSTAWYLYALNATNGALIWAFPNSGEVSSPAVADGRVYIGSTNGKIYALNATDGALIWNYQLGTGYYGGVYDSPAIAYGRVYIASNDGGLYALNATDGAFIWTYQVGLGWYSQMYSSPAVADGRVYIGSPDYKVYALNATTGTQIWNYTTGYFIAESSPAVAYGRVYIGSADYNFYALNATTGAKLWAYGTGRNPAESTPAVADGKVYIETANGLFALNAITGQLIWYYEVSGYSLAIAYGRVYVGSNFKVSAFGVDDVAVAKVKPTKTMGGQGCNMSINVTVTNQGSYTETFNVTAYVNAAPVATQTITLSAGNSANITFTWNNPSFTGGTCNVSAYAWPVLGETNTSDNSLVIAPGDVNADGVVDVLDAAGVSAHWYLGPPIGPLGYDPNFDANCDGSINIIDAGIVSAYWTGPPKGPLAP